MSKPTLKLGARGAEVRELQTLLAKYGDIAIDGVFGPATERKVRWFQDQLFLAVDGVVGPKTWSAILEHAADPVVRWGDPGDLTVDADGWLRGDGVTHVSIHASWHGGALAPKGVVCHVSATDHGTALNMARRRVHKFGSDPNDRLASWHVSVEGDGAIVQMIPFSRQAWHAGSPSAKKIPGLGWANSTTIGIELIGWERGPFPDAQVAGYACVLGAIARQYGIPRERAMISHQCIDPSRRSDPGPVWTARHADHVLDVVFGGAS